MEKRMKKFLIAGFFLPAINATVFSIFFDSMLRADYYEVVQCTTHPI